MLTNLIMVINSQYTQVKSLCCIPYTYLCECQLFNKTEKRNKLKKITCFRTEVRLFFFFFYVTSYTVNISGLAGHTVCLAQLVKSTTVV